MPPLNSVEMCANCCKPMSRCTCRLVSVPVELTATFTGARGDE